MEMVILPTRCLVIGVIILCTGASVKSSTDDFIIVGKGQATCPVGYTDITPKTGCNYASKALGLTFVESDTTVKNNALQNCWTINGNVYHSKSQGNDVSQSSLICKDKCYLYCKNGGKCIKSEKGEPEKCKCSGIYIGEYCEQLRGYTFKEDTTCKKPYADEFLSLKEAFKHCQSSPVCGGISDVHCNHKTFRMCPSKLKAIDSNDNDCLHHKGGASCEDTLKPDTCNNVKNIGLCEDYKAKCRKTCGECGPNVCLDKMDWCKDVKKEMCLNNLTKEQCPKACRLCPGT